MHLCASPASAASKDFLDLVALYDTRREKSRGLGPSNFDRLVRELTAWLASRFKDNQHFRPQRLGGRMDHATYRDTQIAGTTVFTGERSRRGYRINKLAMSLTDEQNRDSFKTDERAYMRRFGLSDHEMELVAKRDWNGLVAAGGSIYLLIKIGGTIGQNLLQMGAQMRGETLDAFMKSRPGHQGTAVERKG
jgi:protocatechuate 4,5-dioxygenase alpha subunit